MASQLFISYTLKDVNYFVELTCTSDVSVSFENKVSGLPVESGSFITDHVSKSPVKIQFSGLLSEINNYSLDYNMSVEDTVRSLKFLRDTHTPFTVNIADNLESYENCVFNNFSLNQTSGSSSSWNASLDMTQIMVSRVSSVENFPDNSVKDQHASKNNQGGNSTEEEDDLGFIDLLTVTLTYYAQDFVNDLSDNFNTENSTPFNPDIVPPIL